MSKETNRRNFIKGSLLTPTAMAMAMDNGQAEDAAPKTDADIFPQGQIGNLKVSRMLLGGNLLTHYTHSRDLKYVYQLAKHYNTEEKILDTLAEAEKHGINTLSIHTVSWSLDVLRRHREERGGKMQWIICPTAAVEKGMKAYRAAVKELVDNGTDAIYLWGVHADRLAATGRADLIKAAIDIPKEFGVPSGLGGHDLDVVKMSEEHDVDPDFYIKTFHHHEYPSGPKPDEINRPYNEMPGYWCSCPDETAKVMAEVKKPWIAFKVMAAGAIPPEDAFQYVVDHGADHVLVGMFDFEIAHDAKLMRTVLSKAKRERPWFS